MGTSNKHGAHFDSFHAHNQHPHGGAPFDAGFGQQAVTDTHGKLFDRFDQRPGVDRYGEHWDDFQWTGMPDLHGPLFDTGFPDRTALEGTEHATWFDAFRDGAQVRYRSDGSDYEGTVIDTERDYVKVQSREGLEHELLYSQVFAWRKGDSPVASGAGDEASRKQPDRPDPSLPADAARGGAIASLNTGSIPRSDAEAPSAHSAEAAGGGPRSHSMAGTDTTFANKTDVELVDVAKGVASALKAPKRGMGPAVAQHKANLHILSHPDAPTHNLACPGCGNAAKYHVRHEALEKGKGGPVSSVMHGECKGCGFKHKFAPPSFGSRGSGHTGKGGDEEADVSKMSPGSHGELRAAAKKPSQSGPATHECAGGNCAQRFHKVGDSFHANGHASQACPSCERSLAKHTPKPLSVTKAVDSTETAAQRKDEEAPADGKTWCPQCKHYCRHDEHGKCPTCGGKTAVKKTDREVLADLAKTL